MDKTTVTEVVNYLKSALVANGIKDNHIALFDSAIIRQVIYYHPANRDSWWWSDENAPRNIDRGWEILIGNTFGVTCSAGINYQIEPALGIHVSVNGMFASWSESYDGETVDGQTTVDISRKMNRLGFLVGLNYNLFT